MERLNNSAPPERLKKLGGKTIDVVLVHGAWHGAWCWDDLVPLLKDRGLNSIAVELPTRDYRKTLDDYARLVARNLEGSTNAILVGHSRGGDVIPRVVDRAHQTKIHEMIFIASALHRATLLSIPSREPPQPNLRRNSQAFEDGIRVFKSFRPWYRKPGADTGDITIFEEEAAPAVLYNTASPERAAQAVKNMLGSPSEGFQWRSDAEPGLKRWPTEVPSTYIRTLEDNAVLPQWQTYRARLIGAAVVDIATDHTPQISDPEALANIIEFRSQTYL